MNEVPPEKREELRQRADQIDTKFYEDFAKRGHPFREQSFEYEKLAVDYSHKGFQTLTYLNGGALVAIPTAMAFFKADVARVDILWTAGAFIFGLLFVVIAQGAAFFTMAHRAEANDEHMWEQFHRVTALLFHYQTPKQTENMGAAVARHGRADNKIRLSNIWRVIGIVCFVASLFAFIAGCAFGARTIIAAKESARLVIE